MLFLPHSDNAFDLSQGTVKSKAAWNIRHTHISRVAFEALSAAVVSLPGKQMVCKYILYMCCGCMSAFSLIAPLFCTIVKWLRRKAAKRKERKKVAKRKNSTKNNTISMPYVFRFSVLLVVSLSIPLGFSDAIVRGDIVPRPFSADSKRAESERKQL